MRISELIEKSDRGIVAEGLELSKRTGNASPDSVAFHLRRVAKEHTLENWPPGLYDARFSMSAYAAFRELATGHISEKAVQHARLWAMDHYLTTGDRLRWVLIRAVIEELMAVQELVEKGGGNHVSAS